MPGTAELQSLVTLEAMSASTPVLLADAMALPHLVRDGENGYLFTPNDSDDLAAKITACCRFPRTSGRPWARPAASMVENHSIERHPADLRGPLPRRQLRRPGGLTGTRRSPGRTTTIARVFLPGTVPALPGRRSGPTGL